MCAIWLPAKRESHHHRPRRVALRCTALRHAGWLASIFCPETRDDRRFIAAIESEFSISRMTVDTERPPLARPVIFQGLIAERECRDIATGGVTTPRRVRTERVGIVQPAVGLPCKRGSAFRSAYLNLTHETAVPKFLSVCFCQFYCEKSFRR